MEKLLPEVDTAHILRRFDARLAMSAKRDYDVFYEAVRRNLASVSAVIKDENFGEGHFILVGSISNIFKHNDSGFNIAQYRVSQHGCWWMILSSYEGGGHVYQADGIEYGYVGSCEQVYKTLVDHGRTEALYRKRATARVIDDVSGQYSPYQKSIMQCFIDASCNKSDHFSAMLSGLVMACEKLGIELPIYTYDARDLTPEHLRMKID